MSKILSTQDVPQKERFDYWNHLVSQALGRLNTVSSGTASFSGKIVHQQLANLDFVNVSSDQLSVIRTEKLISQETTEYIKVNFHLAGLGQLTQNGISTDLRPGDWVAYDNTRPYELTFKGNYEQLLVLVPKQQLAVRVNSLDQALDQALGQAVSSQSGLGKIIADFVKTTLPEIDNIPMSLRPQIVNTFIDLLASNLSHFDAVTNCEHSLQTVSVAQIKNHINIHLAQPELSVETIAKALHISKRYVHHLFQSEEISISRYIWHARLDRCRAELENPHNRHSAITEIAFAWGFNSSSHFSRLFKAQYGLSPRAYRDTLNL